MENYTCYRNWWCVETIHKTFIIGCQVEKSVKHTSYGLWWTDILVWGVVSISPSNMCLWHTPHLQCILKLSICLSCPKMWLYGVQFSHLWTVFLFYMQNMVLNIYTLNDSYNNWSWRKLKFWTTWLQYLKKFLSSTASQIAKNLGENMSNLWPHINLLCLLPAQWLPSPYPIYT